MSGQKLTFNFGPTDGKGNWKTKLSCYSNDILIIYDDKIKMFMYGKIVDIGNKTEFSTTETTVNVMLVNPKQVDQGTMLPIKKTIDMSCVRGIYDARAEPVKAKKIAKKMYY